MNEAKHMNENGSMDSCEDGQTSDFLPNINPVIYCGQERTIKVYSEWANTVDNIIF